MSQRALVDALATKMGGEKPLALGKMFLFPCFMSGQQLRQALVDVHVRVHQMLVLAPPHAQELARCRTKPIGASVGSPLQYLARAQSCVSFKQHLKTED